MSSFLFVSRKGEQMYAPQKKEGNSNLGKSGRARRNCDACFCAAQAAPHKRKNVYLSSSTSIFIDHLPCSKCHCSQRHEARPRKHLSFLCCTITDVLVCSSQYNLEYVVVLHCTLSTSPPAHPPTPLLFAFVTLQHGHKRICYADVVDLSNVALQVAD